MYTQIAIAAAMERELAFLRRALVPADPEKKRISIGTVAGRNICLLRTGVGPEKTARRLAELRESYCPELIISIGCAGALDSSLHVGDAVVSDTLFDDTEDGRASRATPALVEEAAACCAKLGVRCYIGGTVSTAVAAATPQAKQALAGKYGALAVDMESARVARWAEGENIPMLSIRTISDAASDSLPRELAGAFDRNGNLRIVAVVGSLIGKPSILYGAIRLGLNFGRSIDVLARIVHPFLRELA